MYAGKNEFTAFSASIGEALVVFGEIGLFAFVRATHIKNGLIKPLTDCINVVKTGVNLVIDRAPNKGWYKKAVM